MKAGRFRLEPRSGVAHALEPTTEMQESDTRNARHVTLWAFPAGESWSGRGAQFSSIASFKASVSLNCCMQSRTASWRIGQRIFEHEPRKVGAQLDEYRVAAELKSKDFPRERRWTEGPDRGSSCFTGQSRHFSTTPGLYSEYTKSVSSRLNSAGKSRDFCSEHYCIRWTNMSSDILNLFLPQPLVYFGL